MNTALISLALAAAGFAAFLLVSRRAHAAREREAIRHLERALGRSLGE